VETFFSLGDGWRGSAASSGVARLRQKHAATELRRVERFICSFLLVAVLTEQNIL
jgi:hypothetical protein